VFDTSGQDKKIIIRYGSILLEMVTGFNPLSTFNKICTYVAKDFK